MTPLRFEALHADEWTELETLLDVLRQRRRATVSLMPVRGASPERLASLYRRTCEHLALARERAYPAYLVTRLERLTDEAHQQIYQQHTFGFGSLRHLIVAGFPEAVHRDAPYVGVAAAVFLVPTIVLGIIVYHWPELILSIVTAETAASFEAMYSPTARTIGPARTAETDWMMFGFYISNNVGVAFQCFAGGLFAGIGSLFFLAHNAAFGGAVAGYLTERGMGSTFYSFIATHSAFELTAIVLAGGAGLKIGHSLLAPGRLSRLAALTVATGESAVILYGVTGLLIVAAAVEAFWSSATWMSPAIKYGVAAVCWTAVLAYLFLQGRRAR
jgi:uncharacterized membrane protein SpoIIM required for sporulation